MTRALLRCIARVWLARLASPVLAAAACTSAGPDGAGGGSVDAGQCSWPTYLDDAGPGACHVGRAFVQCTYSSGVVCDGGPSVYSPAGLDMGCLSEDPTSCAGCVSTSGPATCHDVCPLDQYAVSCGGPPLVSPDGSVVTPQYQDPPDACVGVGVTPAGNGYYCCPCN
jgi:hypothetical protein